MTRAGAGLALFAAGALGAASATFTVADPDLYWHLATARETLAHGLVRTDVFSWTAANAPVPTDQWLGQLVLYAGYFAGSWTGVLALRTLAVAALVFCVVAAALARRPASPLAATAIAVPALLLSELLWAARPELFGTALLAVLVLLLQLRGDRPLYAAAALLVVWANVHGSFALGAGLALLLAASGLATGDRPRAHLALAGGALVSLVATPSGLGTLASPAVHLFDPPRAIQEWALPDPTTLGGAMWALELGLAVVAATLGRRAAARDLVLVLPTAVLSLVAVRYTPLFAIAATPYLAATLPLPIRLPTGTPRAGPVAALAAAGLLLSATAVVAAPREPDERAFPVAALAALPSGPGLLAEYDWGGWLIWHASATPTFIDGRLAPFRGAILDDYARVVEARPGWRDVLERRGVRWLLVRPRDPVAVRAAELGWPTLAHGAAFVLIEIPHASP